MKGLDGRQELSEKVVDGHVKVACADSLGQGLAVDVGHQLDEARLGLLLGHCCALDIADGFLGGSQMCDERCTGESFASYHGLLSILGRGEGVDVLEDVDFLGD